MKRYLSLEYILDTKNYQQSFEKWMKIRARYTHGQEPHRHKLFDQYLRVIKPIIHRFDSLLARIDGSSYGFCCGSLNEQQLSIVKGVFEPLSKFQIISQVPQDCLTAAQMEQLTQKNYQEIYRLDVTANPTNMELRWWGTTLDVEPITIEGEVVQGKGEGRKNLGMPTANLEMSVELDQKLCDYPNGVYLVDFSFMNGKSFKGAGCLGTNPHYQNFQQRRRLEVYVIHDFGDEVFYGSKVVVALHKLIRFEGKFHSFDAFLNAMHNDIHIARTLSAQQQG